MDATNPTTDGSTPDAEPDGDGLPDYIEGQGDLDYNNPDADGDGTVDGQEDSDGDGVSNQTEVENGGDIAIP